MSRTFLIAASTVIGVSTAVLAYAYLDWRRPILPIRFDTPRSITSRAT